MTLPAGEVVFLVDVDNTLLDSDRVEHDLGQHMEAVLGVECRRSYWRIFEQLRTELGYADYLGALQRYRVEHPPDPQILDVSLFLIDYPFADRLYPRALDTIAELGRRGRVVLLTDGDVVFQPRKIVRSGLWDAVSGNVLVYIHKEQMLDDVERRYPAQHYVIVDDKIRILWDVKRIWGPKVTTIFVRQGHYALDAAEVGKYPAADSAIGGIGELTKVVME
jgi:FMN phosphatase YigB (HAD superfamily)